MTKSEFISFWSSVQDLASRKIDGALAWSCNCEFICHSGGFALEIYPNCIVYPEEIQGLIGLVALCNHRIIIVMNKGYLFIY